MPIIYALEIGQRTQSLPMYSVLAELGFDAAGGVHTAVYETAAPEGPTYWTGWGGNYDDLLESVIISFRLNSDLTETDTLGDLASTGHLVYRDGTKFYISSVIPPWGYSTAAQEVTRREGYLSAALDGKFDTEFRISGEKISYPVRLTVPTGSFADSIGDGNSGIQESRAKKVNLMNNDGKFDLYLAADRGYYNSRAKILKSFEENPDYSDFNPIYIGKISGISINQNDMTLSIYDEIRTFGQEVCTTVTPGEFPDAPEESIGKKIPIAYGEIKKAPVIPVGPRQYIFSDKNYFSEILEVYAESDVYTEYSISESAVLTAENDVKITAVSFMGYSDPAIRGVDIIAREIERLAGLADDSAVWDLVEKNHARAYGLSAGFFFSGGTLKNLIDDVLSAEFAKLITLHGGKLAMRHVGISMSPGNHIIPSWQIMPGVKIHLENPKNLISSAEILYDYDEERKSGVKTVLNFDRELEIFKKYRRKHEISKNTRIDNQADALVLSARMLRRYGTIRQIAELSVAGDTSEINLLDSVSLPIIYGRDGRQMTEVTEWRVIGINRATDSMKLIEEW